MAPIIDDKQRERRLQNLFQAVVRGKRSISTLREGETFFEAIRSHPSPESCIQLLAGTTGLSAVGKAFRISTSSDFIRDHALPLISHLSRPEFGEVCEGLLLRKIIQALADPSVAWQAILELYMASKFDESTTCMEAFAWLSLQILDHPAHELRQTSNELIAALQSRPLAQCPSEDVRRLWYRIHKVIDRRTSSVALPTGADGETPGGRHDNDFADYREIAILPTNDEMTSKARPFYRRASQIYQLPPEERVQGHLDNQLRLLREDMLHELREDYQVAIGLKRGRRRIMTLDHLRVVGIENGDDKRSAPCTLTIEMTEGLPALRNKSFAERKAFLSANTGYLRHNSFGALRRGEDIVGFAFITRDGDQLAKDTPSVGLRFPNGDISVKAIEAIENTPDANFVVVDTPIFAYEHILQRLKTMTELPLGGRLLIKEEAQSVQREENESLLLWMSSTQGEPAVSEDILDDAQRKALATAIHSPLAVIQGPPGTGKSWIGARAAKHLLQQPEARLLVLSYTNHALDQFLEDLLRVGIGADTMTRLGFKSSTVTAGLTFETQFRASDARRSSETNSLFYSLRDQARELREEINQATEEALGRISPMDLLDYLEFSESDVDRSLWLNLQVEDTNDGYTMAGSNGQAISPGYLIDRWVHGQDPGVFRTTTPESGQWAWSLPCDERQSLVDTWTTALRQEHAEHLANAIDRFNKIHDEIGTLLNEARRSFIKGKRVIGCTTTGAAKYASLISAARPTCVLVEEAGEILEAHVLTALAETTEQLILIGDHKQLRPKCNNFGLTVEKGDGYDLNRSLFERLIQMGYPHSTLTKQHRMAPEISKLVRSMTYPDLEDAISTSDRPLVRGIRGRVTWVNHSHPEILDNALRDNRDAGHKSSKKNAFEAEMVLKTVRYMAQQGYKSENIVVLTPYLGQLRLLRDWLRRETDPILSDLDNAELVRAGLATSAAGKIEKGQIRLSTIDNYQGEESDIVIASLTRSNDSGDIGFMKAPERLNVLVSRARNCLIMFGNMETFLASKQGKETWTKFFGLLKDGEHLQDGLIVRCEQHHHKIATLVSPKDFDEKCPDGGCDELCGAKLACGVHECLRRCHRVADHGNIPCEQFVTQSCEKDHTYRVQCHRADTSCPECKREIEDAKRRAQRDLEMEKARLDRQARYRRELQDIQDEIAHLKRRGQIADEDERQKQELRDKQKELQHLDDSQRQKEAQVMREQEGRAESDQNVAGSATTLDGAIPGNIEPGSAREEWELMKRDELASSEALDTLMRMIGLESVKSEFLSIKGKIDTAIRQGISTKSDRFGCTLLGNPGTGKTTVARLYGSFLVSTGVLAGREFEETTGSKLAAKGVSGTQKMVEKMLNSGGGVIFIDEAYQLSSGNSREGLAVLDYLLAEVENLRSKICFVLAGYARQMESFFAHNPGFPSRFPTEMKFDDYTDDELLRILELKTNDRYHGKMKVEGGSRGLFCRIAARRVGRGRGKEGFGNARAIENALQRITTRQSKRLRRERRAKQKPDDLLLTKADIIGPEPALALESSTAWVKMQELVGLQSVKESLKSLLDSVHHNYERELDEQPIIEYTLNRVFLGSPGTGKTTVAQLYGQILVDIGLLSNGEVILKNHSDFVGSVIGGSEKQTNAILDATVGKLLVIDEAYGLYGGSSTKDPFRTAVVDTIVARVQNVPGDDRCVLLLGYRDQMEEMFQKVNPGLSRRFPLTSAFTFEDFSSEDMATILDLKLKQSGFGVTMKAREVAMDILDRARNRPNYGNAGEIDILLNEAKIRHQKRLSSGAKKRKSMFEAPDFDEDVDRLNRAETNVAALFKNTVGCEDIVAKLQGYQRSIRTMKDAGFAIQHIKEQVPFNFVFRGPPGTGKTTTARRVGKVFYDANILADPTVLDCSASDLIAGYLGQTALKVRTLLDKALGRVLLIDEAYRLAEGQFAQEALDEIVDAVTKERYRKRLIIILAGYEKDINRLLSANSGLSSRFSEVIDFHGLDPSGCFDLLVQEMRDRKSSFEAQGKASLDIAPFEHPSDAFQTGVMDGFRKLSCTPNWASARDVKTLGTSVFQTAIKRGMDPSSRFISIDEELVSTCLHTMVSERTARERVARGDRNRVRSLPVQQDQPDNQPESASRLGLETQGNGEEGAPTELEQGEQPRSKDDEGKPKVRQPRLRRSKRLAKRDVDISDEIWEQLLKDVAAEKQRESDYEAKLRAKDETDNDELRERIVRELIEEEERKKKEAEIRERLSALGCCPVGYEWIRQAKGWRCAGGSHYMSDQAVEAFHQ